MDSRRLLGLVPVAEIIRPYRTRRLRPPVVTMALVGVILTTALRLGVFVRELPLTIAFRYGYSGRGLLTGHWPTIFTSQLLTRDVFMAVSIALSLLVMLGPYEVLAGARRTLVVVGAAAVAAPVMVTAVLAFGSGRHLDVASRSLSTLDYGASAITAAGAGAAIAMIGNRRLLWAAIIFVFGGLVLHHQLADWQHLVAFPVGYGLAVLQKLPADDRRRVSRSADRWGLAPRRVPLLAASMTMLALVIGGLAASLTPPAHGATAASSAAASGSGRGGSRGAPTIDDTRYPTPSTGGRRRVIVMLPAGYASNPERRYPVVELLHGRPGSPNDLLTGIDLQSMSSKVAPFIAVIPDGHGPVVSDGDFADTSRQHLGGALSDDLRAWADATYRTDGTWRATGLSAGGYGAAYLASRTPGQYSAVCAMGGYFHALDPAFSGESAEVRAAASPILNVRANGPRTLIIAGAHDLQAVTEGTAYDTALHAVGQPSELRVVPGDHQWPVWQREMPHCLAYLLQGSPP